MMTTFNEHNSNTKMKGIYHAKYEVSYCTAILFIFYNNNFQILADMSTLIIIPTMNKIKK